MKEVSQTLSSRGVRQAVACASRHSLVTTASTDACSAACTLHLRARQAEFRLCSRSCNCSAVCCTVCGHVKTTRHLLLDGFIQTSDTRWLPSQDGQRFSVERQPAGSGGGRDERRVVGHAADLLPHHAAEAQAGQPRAAVQHRARAGARSGSLHPQSVRGLLSKSVSHTLLVILHCWAMHRPFMLRLAPCLLIGSACCSHHWADATCLGNLSFLGTFCCK